MLGRDRILNLIPHRGASFLLDHVASWSADAIACGARSHLDGANPLRRGDRLPTLCGIEYGLQAAALHGALGCGGAPQPIAYLASVRDVEIRRDRLDDPAVGLLRVEADLQGSDPAGMIYGVRLRAEDGTELLAGRATLRFGGDGP